MKPSNTEFFKKRYPLLKRLLDYCLDKLAHTVISLVIGLVVLAYQKHDGKNLKAELHSDTSYLGTNWVGKSMADSHREIYQNVDALNSLSNRLVQLEHFDK